MKARATCTRRAESVPAAEHPTAAGLFRGGLRAAVARAQVRFLPHRGGGPDFLAQARRAMAGVLSVMMLGGCASYEVRTARAVATHQVARDFYRHRYDEACHVPAFPAWCNGRDALLNTYDKHLAEATDALGWVKKSGARMPLQLDALAADRKALER